MNGLIIIPVVMPVVTMLPVVVVAAPPTPASSVGSSSSEHAPRTPEATIPTPSKPRTSPSFCIWRHHSGFVGYGHAMQMGRRQLLAGATAVGVAAGLPQPVRADQALDRALLDR